MQTTVNGQSLTILTDDCINAMSKFDSGSIPLVICSPPYRASKDYGHTPYDDSQSLADYKAFAASWMEEASRVLTDTGSLWVNVGYTKLGPNETLPLTYLYYEIASKLGLKMVQEVTWTFSSGMAYRRRFAHRSERWLWLTKNPDEVLFKLDAVRVKAKRFDPRNNPQGKNPTDVWHFEPVKGNAKEKTSHPCQFPVAMVERIVRACSHEGDTVLDCFGGAGSTAVAAIRQKRSAILIELNEDFAKEAAARLAQPSLLDGTYGAGLGAIPWRGIWAKIRGLR